MNESLLINIIIGISIASVPLIFAAIGELVVERSGVLNLGVEGMMALGAAAVTLEVLHAGIRHMGQAGPAARGEQGEKDDQARHAHRLQGRGQNPQAQGPISQYAHDQVAEVAIGKAGDADDGKGEGDQTSGADTGQESDYAECSDSGGNQGEQITQCKYHYRILR